MNSNPDPQLSRSMVEAGGASTVEIDLRELLSVFFRNLKWILPSSILGLVAAYCLSVYLLPPKYTATVSLYVNSNPETVAGAGLNLNDINASQKLVSTYVVILQDDEVLDQVAEQLQEEYTLAQLADMLPRDALDAQGAIKAKVLREDVISLKAVNNTEVLSIGAVTKNPEFSARICSIMVEVAPEILTRVVKAGSVEVIGEAKAPDEPSSPRVMLNSAIGLLVGLVVSAATVFLRYFLDNTIKDEEDLRRRYHLPVLGEIPDADSAPEGGYKRYGA